MKFKNLKTILAVAICFSILTPNAFANNEEQDELTQAIENNAYTVSGSGTIEDPYVLDGSDNVIQRYLDEKFHESMNADKTRGTVAYPLKGTAHTLSASADGAYWDYVKGGQTSSVYDSTIYLSIDYIGKNLTEQIYGVMMSTTKVKQITAALVGVGTKALAVKALVAIGYSTKLASAITICAGFIGKYTLGITNFAKPIQSKEFNDAINQKKGVVHVYYKYSISGTWYYNDSYDVWDTFPVAKEPLTGFGEGDFHTGIRP